jgi:transcriptional regulator with XRE-family HTH domain
MPFDQTFYDLRKRRRIPMRLFTEKVGISPSYIHEIEKGGLLPSEQKLRDLASVFVEVAREQEAADPEGDARRLFRERDRTAFVERLGIEPELAEALSSLRDFDDEQRAELIEPLELGLTLFRAIAPQERHGLVSVLSELLETSAKLRRENRHGVLSEAVTAAYKVLERAGPASADGEAQSLGEDEVAEAIGHPGHS